MPEIRDEKKVLTEAEKRARIGLKVKALLYIIQEEDWRTRPGRSNAWQKVKTTKSKNIIIV